MPSVNKKEIHLQGVGEEFVHLGHLGRDADVDGSVADLDNQASNNVGVHLCASVSSWENGEYNITRAGLRCW